LNRHPQSELRVWNKLRNSECSSCELHTHAKTVCLLGDGPIPAKAMVVGEAPGFTEDEKQIPFCGESGIFLRRSLKDIGIDPKTLYFTTAVACRPEGSRPPKTKEIKTCSRLYLLDQLRLVRPKAILVLGNAALQFFKGKKAGITKAEGSTFSYPPKQDSESEQKFLFDDLQLSTMTCVPSRHPSNVLRLRDQFPLDYKASLRTFQQSLRLFKNAIDPQEDKLKFHKTFDLGRFNPKRSVYVDIETNGLSPFRPNSKIHCQGLTQGGDTLTTFRVTDESFNMIRRMLMTFRIMCHRNMFEGTWYRQKYGITPMFAYDTKVGAHLQNENEESGLKYQAIKYLKVEPWSEEQDWEEPDWTKLPGYNARDNKYGYRLLVERDTPYLKKHPKTLRLVKHILMPAMEVFTEIVCNGYHVDPEKAKAKLKTVRAKLTKLNKQLNDISGWEINPSSPKQVSKFFYDQLRLQCPVMTKGGKKGIPQRSTAEAALIRLRGQHPATDILWEWRGWKKYETTYLEPWIRLGPELHAGYDFTGTTTSRLSSSMIKNKRGEKKLGAVIHQCPRDPFIRNLVSPRGYVPYFDVDKKTWGMGEIVNDEMRTAKKAQPEDWFILAADLSQIELRLVAHYANELTMIGIFNSGGDIHTATARTLQPTGEIVKETRKKAKAVNFGFVYGMMWKKFMEYALEKFDLKLNPAESKEYRRKFFAKYSGLLSWHKRVEAFVKHNGYVESALGRIRHLPEACAIQGLVCGICNGEGTKDCWGCDGSGWCVEPGGDDHNEWMIMEAVRQAINSPIQGDGSNILLFIIALIASISLKWEFKVDRRWAFPIGSAHDSMLWEVHKGYAKELRDGIKHTVKSLPKLLKQYFDVQFKVPILMDCNVYRDCWEGQEIAYSDEKRLWLNKKND
jgi:uracil-DNA glycosylase family 4